MTEVTQIVCSRLFLVRIFRECYFSGFKR